MAKSKNCYYHADIGCDLEGTPCIYIQWRDRKSGEFVRYATEKELQAFVEEINNSAPDYTRSITK